MNNELFMTIMVVGLYLLFIAILVPPIMNLFRKYYKGTSIFIDLSVTLLAVFISGGIPLFLLFHYGIIS